jgi:hypothetical protein
VVGDGVATGGALLELAVGVALDAEGSVLVEGGVGVATWAI